MTKKTCFAGIASETSWKFVIEIAWLWGAGATALLARAAAVSGAGGRDGPQADINPAVTREEMTTAVCCSGHSHRANIAFDVSAAMFERDRTPWHASAHSRDRSDQRPSKLDQRPSTLDHRPWTNDQATNVQ